MAPRAIRRGYGKNRNFAVQAGTTDGSKGGVERVPVGAYRSTSTAAKAKQERIVLERDSGPRLEARKEEKGKRKVAKVTPEFAGAVGKPAQCGKLHQGNWNRSLNAVEEDRR